MILRALLLLIPVSIALDFFAAPPLLIFAAAALAIVPLAEYIRHATEQLSAHAGSVVGGLLNVTFGNAAELILALFVLYAGKEQVVKATITGSIIGNSLLGLGIAIVAGTWGRERLTFIRERSGLLSSLLVLSTIALLLPAFYNYLERDVRGVANVQSLDEYLSLGVAVVLILAYGANLAYTLVTHRDVFGGAEEEGGAGQWSVGRALGVLVAATAVVAWEAELVSGALEATAAQLGLTEFFLGLIALPLVGNAAEYFAAVYFARQGKMDLVMGIALGASIQIVLLTAPILVLIGYFTGHPMDLVFDNPLELVAIAGIAFIVRAIAEDGETTWFEGVMLLVVYALLALTFFFVTPE